MESSWYYLELGANAACTNILMDETKGLGERVLKGSMRYCFMLNSCFLSKKAAEEGVYIGDDFIIMVKTNTNRFCKAMVEGSVKDWPDGSYMVLRRNTMVPGEMPLMYIGYKYNSQKVL